MSVAGLLKTHTRRQILILCRWFEERESLPSATHHYIMQLTAEVRQLTCIVGGYLGVKIPPKSPGDFQIGFGSKVPPGQPPLPPDEELPPGFPRRLTKEKILQLQRDMRRYEIESSAINPRPKRPPRPPGSPTTTG